MQQPYYNSINFGEDSFQQHPDSVQQMQNSHVPSAIPASLHFSNPAQQKKSTSSLHSRPKHEQLATNYDLTFKKHQQFQLISNPENLNQVKQNLFADHGTTKYHKNQQNNENDKDEPRQVLINILKKSISIQQTYMKLKQIYPHLSSLEIELSSLIVSHGDYLSLKVQIQTKCLLSAITIRNLRKKRNSAKLNIEVLRVSIAQKDSNEVDKKRLELLGLLVIQIDKKLMIQGLKYNAFYRQLACGEFQEEDSQEMDQSFGSQHEHQVSEEEYDEKIQQQPQNKKNNFSQSQSEKISPIKTTSHTRRTPYQQQTRLAVFSQMLSSLFNKTIYSALRKINEFSMKSERRPFQEIPIHNNHIGEEQDRNEQHQDPPEESQIDEFQENQQPIIEEIERHIETLKEDWIKFPKKKQEIIKNYFLRWKIFFLRAMVDKIQQKDLKSQYQINYEMHQPVYEKQFISNKSIDGALKEEKFSLKQYLRLKRLSEFYKTAKQWRASQQIKGMMKYYHLNSLKRKAFQALFQHKKEKSLEEYYERRAQDQNQVEIKTSQIYYKTNCLAKAFFGLKSLTKYSKFVKLCQNFLRKYVLSRLKYEMNKNEQNETKLQKYFQRKKRQVYFKCFSILKNEAFSSELYCKVDTYKKKKQVELMDLCFSALSLVWKKQLALQKRVQKNNNRYCAKSFLQKLAGHRNTIQYERNMQMKALFITNWHRKINFINNLELSYLKSLQNRRIEVKMTKLQIQKTKILAKQKLKQWRRGIICQNNYQVIEGKLKKVKQLQIKQKMLKIWRTRTKEKSQDKRKDKLTQNHKLWLNRYYQKLCQIQDQHNI